MKQKKKKKKTEKLSPKRGVATVPSLLSASAMTTRFSSFPLARSGAEASVGSCYHLEVIMTQEPDLCLALWMALPAASSLCSALHTRSGGGTKEDESFDSDTWHDKSGNFQNYANRMPKLMWFPN